MENIKERRENISRFPLYKMLSWDLLFYYAIIFLFLTEVKKISPSMVFLSEALYTIFKIIFTIPSSRMIERIGKRNSLILANSSIAISIAILLLSKKFIHIIIFQFFSALGYVIKGNCESNILYDSIIDTAKRGKLFAKIDGQATSLYFYTNAVTAIVSGFLYVVNPYIPIFLCLVVCLISTFLSTRFNEVRKLEPISRKRYIREVKVSFINILKSPRLRNLIIFGGLFYGFLAALVTLRSSLLKDIGLPDQYFGLIFAILEIISGIATKNQEKIHNRYRNKTLTFLSIPVTVSCILIGIIAKIPLQFILTVVLLLGLYIIQYTMKGPFYILIKKYLNNFTKFKIRNKIATLYNLVENILRAIILLAVSILLNHTTTDNTFLIIGIIFTLGLGLLLLNMKQKVGLKPEEYGKKDMEFLKLK